jgi:ADP-ribosyl-[dinitrogen reductase] hydrolase
MKTSEKIKDALLGFAVGDALGSPVESQTRESLAKNPVKGMIGNMIRNQPPGTWSDDSSLVFCTCESLCNGYNLEDIAVQFSNWKNKRFWTPHRRVYTMDIQIEKSIERIDRCIEMGIRIKPYSSEGVSEKQNGNGSLMRILPLAFYPGGLSAEDRFKIIKDISSLTHPHIRAVTGCFIYREFAAALLTEKNKMKAYDLLQNSTKSFLEQKINASELKHYSRILMESIGSLSEKSIESTQYVVHSLEAALWCVMRSGNYRDTVLAAVNLGGDADTIGALAGGLAGILYGTKQIPEEWLSVLARKDDIIDLAARFASKVNSEQVSPGKSPV